MAMKQAIVISACVTGALAAACVSPDEAPATGTATQALESCPNFACGQNGPTLNNRPFHELAESRVPNQEGFALGRLVKNGTLYAIQVVGWELRASNRFDQLTGNELVGASFEISHAQDGKTYRVLIAGYALMQIYAGPLKGTSIPQYVLKWTDPAAPVTGVFYKNLCANPPKDRAETLYQDGESTIFFEGNRYDAGKKLVSTGDTNWFNLGCAGHALSKLFLTGHAQLTGGATLLEQQTVLKALVADYCQDGMSFTVPGERLSWKTANQYMLFQDAPVSFEARWNSLGPVCMDEARLIESGNPLAQTYFPDAPDGTSGVIAAMQQHCPSKIPPPCNAAAGAYNFSGSYLVTANPPL